MLYWLLKSEPDAYSFDRLCADGFTRWDGISNNLALKYLRQMKAGDLAFIYHSGTARSIVGVAEITSAPYPDPALAEPKYVVVDVKPIYPLPRPIPLAEIRSRKEFSSLELLKIPRLSVMPVSESHWTKIISLSKSRPKGDLTS